MKLFFILSCTDARQRDTEKLRAVNKNPRFKDSLGGKKFIIFHSRRAGHGRGEAKSDSWCCRAQSMLSWAELSCQGRYGCIWVCVLSFFLALQAPCEAQNWQRWLTTQQYKPECEKKQKRPFSLSLSRQQVSDTETIPFIFLEVRTICKVKFQHNWEHTEPNNREKRLYSKKAARLVGMFLQEPW